jgi:hypothetical protein
VEALVSTIRVPIIGRDGQFGPRARYVAELERDLDQMEFEYNEALKSPDKWRPDFVEHFKVQLAWIRCVRVAMATNDAALAAAGMWQIENRNRNVTIRPYYERGVKQLVDVKAGTAASSIKAAERKAQWPNVLRTLERDTGKPLSFTEKLYAIQHHEESQGRSISESSVKRFLSKPRKHS